MNKKILVLGAGMVGSAIALDLAKKYEVTVADKNDLNLKALQRKNMEVIKFVLDFRHTKQLSDIVKSHDLVISAVPGFIGYETLKTVIECGVNIVDISFFPENALNLNDLAIQHGVTAIVDCGVAPGLDNMILGHINNTVEINTFECIVGGLPKSKKWPFNYKAPFSPVDVIEEYTRPARYVENGEVITKEALSDCEFVEFDNIGTLESFNSDGLRSLIYTMKHIPNMKEKTLRYPGHVEYIKVLRDSGFFQKEPISVYEKLRKTEMLISPLDVTSQILFKEWKLNENEEEFTVMRVSISGQERLSGKIMNITYDLYDEFDKGTNTSSMARTTGYTATAAVELILNDHFSIKGVFPPEVVVSGVPNCFDVVLTHLKERGVKLNVKQNYL
jgi:saccharopine dehydrogenase-like NADP-dependent oxidoreductase